MRIMKRLFARKGEPHAAAAFEQSTNVFCALFHDDAALLPSIARTMSQERRAFKYLRRLDLLLAPMPVGTQSRAESKVAALKEEPNKNVDLHAGSSASAARASSSSLPFYFLKLFLLPKKSTKNKCKDRRFSQLPASIHFQSDGNYLPSIENKRTMLVIL